MELWGRKRISQVVIQTKIFEVYYFVINIE